MKRLIALSFIMLLVFSMVACGSDEPVHTSEVKTGGSTASTETAVTTSPTEIETIETTEPEETHPASGVYGGNIVLGNITFEIPEDFTVTVVNEASFVLSSDDDACAIALSAFDISELDEENAKKYLPMSNEALVNFDDLVVVPADEDIIGEIAGFPVTMRACGTYDGSNMIFHADTTFTDSWYAYTIIYKSDLESEKHSDYNSLLIDFLFFAKHNGREARFDFIQ